MLALAIALALTPVSTPKAVPPFDWELTVENRKTGEKTVHPVSKQLSLEVGDAQCELRLDEPVRVKRMREQQGQIICWSTHQGRKSLSVLVLTRSCVKAYTATKEMNRWFNEQENGQAHIIIQATSKTGEASEIYALSTRCLK